MALTRLVENRDELRTNVIKFADTIAALAKQSSADCAAIANGCSHAVEWVAFQDDAGEWKAAFCKFAGYEGLTFQSYNKLRQTHLTGTDTKRRVEKLGGAYFGVGADSGHSTEHPAVDAVEAVCKMFGKTPKRTAKVRVYPTEGRPASMDVLVAAIRAAKLKDSELNRLFAEVRAAA